MPETLPPSASRGHSELGAAADRPPGRSERLRSGPLRTIAGSATAVPALVMVGAFVGLGAASGGYYETAYLPAALLAVALLGISLVTISTRALIPRAVALAVGLFGAYAAWSYLSIVWAADQGAAWEGANRALLYAVVFALFALWPMRGLSATAVLGAFGLGVAGLGVVTLLNASAAADVSGMLVSGRFVEPVGYVNGNVALWFSGFLPCVFLAARREVWPPVRGLAIGGAAVLAGLSVLGQSRGWLVALPLTLVLFIAVVPGRARNGTVLLAVAVAVAVALDPVLDVFGGIEEGLEPAPLVHEAARAVLRTGLVLAVLGALAALADRRVALSPPASNRLRAGALAVLATAVVAGAGVGIAAVGNPVAEATDAWADFRAGSEPGEEPSGSSRFTSAAGGNRYDFWRVALEQFADQPLLGAGTGSFQTAYLREGESVERPQFPHSLELRLLSETGILGALLFVGGVLAACLAAARGITRRRPLAGAAAGTALSTAAYWALHGSVDWFYELPALGASAFGMLGLAAALAPRHRLAEPRRPGSGALVGRRLAAVGLLAAALLAVAALGLPWLAQRHVDAAAAGWNADPEAAFESLGTAADLNPLSVDPHATAAAIALRLERPEAARAGFEAVLERDPQDAYSTLELGALASAEGDREQALELVRRAAELSPRDVLIDEALAGLRDGERLDAADLYEEALERRSALTGDG